MPKCKNCPIVAECNKHPVLVDASVVKGPKPKKATSARLCPLLVMLSTMTEKPEG